MKINIIILTLFFFFFSKLNAGQIFIVVKNIEEKVGSIHFALYDDADFFPDNEGKKIGFKKDVNEVNPVCPTCNDARMELRVRKNDNTKFWGCYRFPACKGSKKYEGSL